MRKEPYRHRRTTLSALSSRFKTARAWLPFIAMTSQLCPHIRPLFDEPIRTRATCTRCDDVVIFREFISRTALIQTLGCK